MHSYLFVIHTCVECETVLLAIWCVDDSNDRLTEQVCNSIHQKTLSFTRILFWSLHINVHVGARETEREVSNYSYSNIFLFFLSIRRVSPKLPRKKRTFSDCQSIWWFAIRTASPLSKWRPKNSCSDTKVRWPRWAINFYPTGFTSIKSA